MRLDSQEYEPAIDDLFQAGNLEQTLEYDLRLMLWGNGSGVPTSGNNLAIVGVQYFNDLPFYRIRYFDVGGKVREYDGRASLGTNIDEEMARAKQLSALLPPHEMTGAEKAEVTGIVTEIIGHPDTQVQPRVRRRLPCSGPRPTRGEGVQRGDCGFVPCCHRQRTGRSAVVGRRVHRKGRG